MKYQRGSVEIILMVVLGLAAVSAGGMAIHSYTSAISKAEQAETARVAAENQNKITAQALADQRVLVTAMQKQKEMDDKLDAERIRHNNIVADLKRKQDAKLAIIINSSPEIKKWADTPVPTALIAELRGQPSDPTSQPGSNQDGKGKDTGVKNTTNPGARLVVPKPDKWTTIGRNPLIGK